MRVSVVNFCSTALDMLDFSTRMLRINAGTNDYDYCLVTWNATNEIAEWIDADGRVAWSVYETNPDLEYVPNLRAMMSAGFNVGYNLNDFVCIVNTDMAFGTDWLINLVKHATEDVISNSLHLSPIKGPNVVTIDCGVPTRTTFDADKFWRKHDDVRFDGIETEEQRGGWRATNTLPYVIHRKWWDRCGPWVPRFATHGNDPPDRQFFERCHNHGARHVLVGNSVCYHHEAAERRSRRPPGVENMPEGR